MDIQLDNVTYTSKAGHRLEIVIVSEKNGLFSRRFYLYSPVLKSVRLQVQGTYFELNSKNEIIFGSVPSGHMIEDMTRGHFREGFTGCISDIEVQDIDILADISDDLIGENILECDEE